MPTRLVVPTEVVDGVDIANITMWCNAMWCNGSAASHTQNYDCWCGWDVQKNRIFLPLNVLASALGTANCVPVACG